MKLIIGKMNNCNVIYFWGISTLKNTKVGDYAIVENMSDYDLVKVIGLVETTEKYVKKITKCNEIKKVIKIIDRKEIRED